MVSARRPGPAGFGAVLAGLAVVAACGPVERRPVGEVPDPASQPADLSAASLAAANLKRGELLSLACQACHPFAADGGNNIGPNLHGIFGKRAANSADFAYSDAMRQSGILWSPAEIDHWLSDPAGFVAGSAMTFAGYADPVDRRDLIAYLLQTLGTGRE